MLFLLFLLLYGHVISPHLILPVKTRIIFKLLNEVCKKTTFTNVKRDNGCRENTAIELAESVYCKDKNTGHRLWKFGKFLQSFVTFAIFALNLRIFVNFNLTLISFLYCFFLRCLYKCHARTH